MSSERILRNMGGGPGFEPSTFLLIKSWEFFLHNCEGLFPKIPPSSQFPVTFFWNDPTVGISELQVFRFCWRWMESISEKILRFRWQRSVRIVSDDVTICASSCWKVKRSWNTKAMFWIHVGQCLWRSRQSGRFWHQRSAVRILPSANNLSVNHLLIRQFHYRKDENKE